MQILVVKYVSAKTYLEYRALGSSSDFLLKVEPAFLFCFCVPFSDFFCKFFLVFARYENFCYTEQYLLLICVYRLSELLAWLREQF